MPPISPQGSRTGLVTTLVVFVILFVTTTILWIYESAERRNRDDQVTEMKKRLTEVVDEATISSPDVEALKRASTENPAYSGMSAMQVALKQRGELSGQVAGTAATYPQVQQRISQAMARATANDVGAGIAKTMSLSDTVTRLAERLAQLNQERDALATQVEAAKAETQQVIAKRDDLLKQKDAEIAKVSQEMQGQMTQLAAFRQQTEGTVQQIQLSSNTTLTQHQQQNDQLTAALNQAQAAIKQKDQQIDALTQRLKGVRVNPNEATIQKADGEIVRLPGNGLAVINLGVGDHVAVGMTFKVFDRFTGVPSLGADGTRETDMPVGKGELQIVRIGPGFSECRIISKEPGISLVQGDLVVNLVYDRTQKYSFVVYGDFDLDGDGRTAPGDAEVIRRLITQWGGNVVNEVNVNTDFVIMGREPKVDAKPPADNAVEQAAYQRAMAELDKYLEVRKQAMALNIPILNQNRFLNFVGYTSQAGR
jgi:outer membrane murein-binding lipoprotein Lpp